MAKKCLKWTGICIGVVLLCAIALLLWLTIAEYNLTVGGVKNFDNCTR